MSTYLAAGQSVFAHEGEGHRQSVTVGWSAGDPALDERSLPTCRHCKGPFVRVPACEGEHPATFDEKGAPIAGSGDHECHPLAGHVSRSDDHTRGLVADPKPPEPTPAEIQEARRQFVRWVVGQQAVIRQTAALLEAAKFRNEWEREDCELTHELAVAQLKARGVDPE